MVHPFTKSHTAQQANLRNRLNIPTPEFIQRCVLKSFLVRTRAVTERVSVSI